ncbi:MAG: TetR/AcrR family transcriptional regulator [Cyanobacteria bacterium SID2]|nr:TetR/AcrR family transcriptional regulator [Cyanobacteria bacterium SID2]MBP0002904.1 TetR/AcrR family transcriptional regulator [Cyanobacteria bacterium SBC]
MSASKTYHHGNLRQALIDTAIETIAEKGVNSLSLREVARRVGVSHSASYRHFADKEALLAAVAEEGFLGLTQALTTALQNRLETTADCSLERLQASGIAYVKYAFDRPEYYRVMFGSGAIDRSRYPSLQNASQQAFQVLVDLVIAGQNAEKIRPGDPVKLAWVAWSLVHGLAMLAIDGQLPISETHEIESIARFTTQTLSEGLSNLLTKKV